MSEQRKSWTFRVSRHFMARQDIPAMAKVVGIALLCYADKDGICCPTMLQLAKDLDLNEATIETRLDQLRSVNAISWTVWTDEFGHKRRNYNLQPAGQHPSPSMRLFLKSDWDGLGGKSKDGRRTLMNPPI